MTTLKFLKSTCVKKFICKVSKNSNTFNATSRGFVEIYSRNPTEKYTFFEIIC